MQTHPTPTSIARNLGSGTGDWELLRAGATLIDDLNLEVDRAGSRRGKLNPDGTASAGWAAVDTNHTTKELLARMISPPSSQRLST
jgi:hypothetical protein